MVWVCEIRQCQNNRFHNDQYALTDSPLNFFGLARIATQKCMQGTNAGRYTAADCF
jgi:hypothetical protein